MQIVFLYLKIKALKGRGDYFFQKNIHFFQKKLGVACVKAEFAAQRGEPFCAGFWLNLGLVRVFKAKATTILDGLALELLSHACEGRHPAHLFERLSDTIQIFNCPVPAGENA